MVLVVTGVSGSGKTTVGRALAVSLGWRFLDADDFHSASSLRKMRAGVPLDDDDRAPWLARLREAIRQSLSKGRDLVLACSALKSAYRARLRVDPRRVKFVRLVVPEDTLRRRLEKRPRFILGPELLDSQLSTQDAPDEGLETFDGALPVHKLVDELGQFVG